MTQSRAPLIAAVLLLLPVLYVGSYFAMVVPGSDGWLPPAALGDPPQAVYPYRAGGIASAIVFWPLEQIDRKVRPGAWEMDLPHYGDFGPTKHEPPDLSP